MKVAEIVKETSMRVDITDVTNVNGSVSSVVVKDPSSPSSSSGPHSSPLGDSRKRTLDSSVDGLVDGQKRVRTLERTVSSITGDEIEIDNLLREKSDQLDKEGTSKEPHIETVSLILNDTEKDDAIGGTDGMREEGDENNDDEEEEEEDEGAFFSALKEFEGKDIEALKAFISSHEQ